MQNATFGLAKWVIPKISLLIIIWLVVWNIFYFSIYWESSSRLTFIFFRKVETTNQIYISAYMSWISYQIHRSHRWVLEEIVTTPKNGCNGWLYDYPRTGNPVLNQPVYWKRGGEGGIGMPIGGTVEAGGRWAQVILQTGWTSNIAIPK